MFKDEFPATRNAIGRLQELCAARADRSRATDNGSTAQASSDTSPSQASGAVAEEGGAPADRTAIDGASSLQLTLAVPDNIAEIDIRVVLHPLRRSLTTTIACGYRSDASSPRGIGP